MMKRQSKLDCLFLFQKLKYFFSQHMLNFYEKGHIKIVITEAIYYLTFFTSLIKPDRTD